MWRGDILESFNQDCPSPALQESIVQVLQQFRTTLGVVLRCLNSKLATLLFLLLTPSLQLNKHSPS